MTPHHLSSGDLIADRRADYARMLAETGDHADAAELMRQALELVPDWAAGWFRLADYEEKSGRREAAVEALSRVLALNPEDMFGAGLKLAVLGGGSVPVPAPSAYVARLFDDYAARFDTALVGTLDYTVPRTLAALVRDSASNRRFSLAIDLGCGTGLFGAEIRASTERLEGFDLSSSMLARAADKKLYDHLGIADLSRPPQDAGVLSPDLPAERADLVSAADVMMYLGDLTSVFPIVRRLLTPGGVFAFSVEDAGDDGAVVLRPSLRYAHSQDHVEQLCDESGLKILSATRSILRKDGRNSISGILFVTRLNA